MQVGISNLLDDSRDKNATNIDFIWVYREACIVQSKLRIIAIEY